MRRFERFPTYETLLAAQRELTTETFSYSEVGATRTEELPEDYDHDQLEIFIGKGPAALQAGKSVLQSWQQLPPDWVRIFPANTPLSEGNCALLLARLFGFWWLNGVQVVYTIDTPERYAFAYGTLQSHVEQGEERFELVMDAAENVQYRLRAFSRPGYWASRLAYPLARRQQRRFARQSLQRMRKLVEELQTDVFRM